MSTQAITVKLVLDAADFERLCENSGDLRQAMPWLYERLMDGAERLADDPGHREWRHIYWTGAHYASMILARSFLEAWGEDYQVVVDEGSDEAGNANGWAILTDYASPVWQRQGNSQDSSEEK